MYTTFWFGNLKRKGKLSFVCIYIYIYENTFKKSHYRPGQVLGVSRRFRLPDFRTIGI